MFETEIDQSVQKVMDVRKVGADYEEHQQSSPLDIPVDLHSPDIAEKSAHVTCPASIIETAKMHNPNMKVEILAIPPRVSKEDVCCRWRLSMRTPDDPEYVQSGAD